MLKGVLAACLLNGSLRFTSKKPHVVALSIFQNVEPTEILMYAF